MNSKKIIPYGRQYISRADLDLVKNSLTKNLITTGNFVKTFEKKLKSKLNSKYILTCNSGTSAIMCALLANGFKQGDKVIVPDFTFYATLSSAKILGAQIITADIDIDTLNLSPQTVEELVKNNDVKFVIVVDVAGLSVDIEAFEELTFKISC